MSVEPLYKIGDFVKVKDLDKLKEELGYPIHAQCGWFSIEMDKFAGGVYEVVQIFSSNMCEFHYSYRFRETGGWWFSEDTIDTEWLDEIEVPSKNVSMSYEELMGIS